MSKPTQDKPAKPLAVADQEKPPVRESASTSEARGTSGDAKPARSKGESSQLTPTDVASQSPEDRVKKPAAAKRAKPVAKAVAKPKRSSAPPPEPKAPPSDSTPALKEPGDDEQSVSTPGGVGRDTPGWLTSLVVHLVILIVFSLWSLPQLPELTTALLHSEPSSEDLEEFEDVPEFDFEDVSLEEPVEFEMQPETDVIAEAVSFSDFDEALSAPSFTELSDLSFESAAPSNPTDMQGFDGTGTTGRGRMARQALVRKHGGTQASEQAVANALEWFANHQAPDGSWSLVHNQGECRGRCPDASVIAERPNGYADSLKSGTGLALLSYLGAGQTHKQGKHRRVVDRGLRALIALGEKDKDRPGLSWRDSGNMYAHGIAAIALTEAYGMTRDDRLRGPAQAALDYIVYCQNPKDGGWRYTPRSPGDTSVTGWQVMALKSGYLAGLSVPSEVVNRAAAYLDAAQRERGSRYVYLLPETDGKDRKPTYPMDAVGLLCRMYLGWDREQSALVEGVERLAKRGPSEKDFYYNYYAAQVIFQHTGGRGLIWRRWNQKMRDLLVEQQAKTGHAKGSWYVKGKHSDRGGRVYMTSLAAMSLEVYYRYMPIYRDDAVKKDF